MLGIAALIVLVMLVATLIVLAFLLRVSRKSAIIGILVTTLIWSIAIASLLIFINMEGF